MPLKPTNPLKRATALISRGFLYVVDSMRYVLKPVTDRIHSLTIKLVGPVDQTTPADNDPSFDTDSPAYKQAGWFAKSSYVNVLLVLCSALILGVGWLMVTNTIHNQHNYTLFRATKTSTTKTYQREFKQARVLEVQYEPNSKYSLHAFNRETGHYLAWITGEIPNGLFGSSDWATYYPSGNLIGSIAKGDERPLTEGYQLNSYNADYKIKGLVGFNPTKLNVLNGLNINLYTRSSTNKIDLTAIYSLRVFNLTSKADIKDPYGNLLYTYKKVLNLKDTYILTTVADKPAIPLAEALLIFTYAQTMTYKQARLN